MVSSSRCRVHHSSELERLTGGKRRGNLREGLRHEATGLRLGGKRAATVERPSLLLVCGSGGAWTRGRPGSFQCARARVLDSGSDDFFKSSDGTAAGSSYYYRRSDRELRNQGRGGGVGTTEGTAGGCSAVQSSNGKGWRLQIFIVGTAMLLCNLDRVAMGILAVPLIQEFSLSMTELGVLQSSYLWGYLIGQIPAGLASDKYGGVEVMLVGLFVWSVATCGTALAKYAAAPLTIAIASRVLMGLGSSVALPAVAATVAKEVPPNQRARSTTISYALFNIGNVVANLCTPYVSEFLGWHWSFAIYGALGVVWTAVCFYLLKGSKARRQKSAVTLKELQEEPPKKSVNILQAVRKKKLWAQLLILAYCHSTIGLGYFTLQSWIPAFMAKDLGIASLKVAGLYTALVWLATSFNTAFVGVVADKLLNKMEFWKVRRIAMTISTIIPASCFFVLSTTSNPLVGVCCILVGLVSWSFDYAGFHPYIVEVSGKYSGTVLSFTNSAGVIAGIAGNIATGYLVGLEGNFTRVFRILAGVYLLSCILWNLTMRGEKLELV